MLLGGLWHGAAWTYVFWGAYQGALLMAFRTGAEALARKPQRWLDSPWAKAMGVVAMFHLTCYGWLIFRAKSAGQIGSMTASLLGPYDFSAPDVRAYFWQLLFYAGPLVILHAIEAWRNDLVVVLRFPPLLRYAIYAGVFYLTVLWGDFGGAQFIYFQF